MGTDGNRFYDVARQGLAFVLRLSLVLGGLGFASVLAVAQVAGGIYLITAGHSAGGYALVAGAVVLECLVLSLMFLTIYGIGPAICFAVGGLYAVIFRNKIKEKNNEPA